MSDIRNKYHIKINGKGFMLRGSPTNPQYVKEEAPAVSNQVGTGDVSYATLNGSGWSYFAQTDWSGGNNSLKFKDDASFKDGQAVDCVRKYGQITIQNGFTSAVSISGSHSYGAHAVHNNVMILGTVKAGAAKLFSLTSAGTIATLSAMAGISAVNTMSRFKNDTIIGLTRTSGTSKTLVKYNGTAISGFRNANPIVRSVKAIGIRAYTGEKVAALSGDVLYYSTDLSTFTSAYQAGKNRNIKKIENLNGSPYFFIEEGRRVEMFRWDEFAERAYPIYTWEDLTNWGTTSYASFIVITGTSNGTNVAFAFNGAKLWSILDDQLLDSSVNMSKPFEFNGLVHTKGLSWDGAYWFPGIYGKFANAVYTPFANFANRAYGYVTTGTTMKIGYQDTTKYNISGHVISSEYGSNIGGVDKLVNSVNINMDALATGQTIEILHSVDGGSTFTSVGTAKYSTDGAIKKKLMNIPSGLITKLWNYKAVLVGPGTSTPTLKDVTFEYRPVPDLKKRWGLSIDAGDNITLLNRQKEQRDGKALMEELWLEKEAKRTVVFEDVNSFEIDLLSAMTSTATTALVKDTRFMPPKGRMRILSAGKVEEMTYTSADGGKIKGISRAQKGTLARSYTSANVIDNNYTVMVTNIKEQVNDTDQSKTESVAQVTLLEI